MSILGRLIGSVVQTPVKGVLGETKVKLGASLTLNSVLYQKYHNVTLPTVYGTTQIDHVFVSEFGVFVVETKNVGGRISGGEHDKEWTKVFPGGQKHKFRNPLLQNNGHVRAIEKILAGIGLPKQSVKSVVVFVGDAKLEQEMPQNVTMGFEAARYIRSFKTKILTDEQVEKICTAIESSRLRSSRATNRQHIQNLKRKTAPDLRICPKCGRKMVLRTTRKGPNEGKQFWECRGYPKCRMRQKT